MPGGPFPPPPCRRCGTTENFFASGLCARCHRYGTIRVDACADCHAWGATRTGKWLCHPCQHWRAAYRMTAACIGCAAVMAVDDRGACRLCRVQARAVRVAKEPLDVIAANRHGAQLFLANMHKAATHRAGHIEPRAVAPPRPARPVTHRQLLLFTMAPSLAGGRGVVGPPRDPVLAAILDDAVTQVADDNGWDWRYTTKIRSGIRLLVGLQDTPGAAIRHTDTAVLVDAYISRRQVLAVLAAAGMLDDDRTPVLRRWFDHETVGLAPAITGELTAWFDTMHDGSPTPPRRKPRSPTTIKVYLGAALPALRRWTADGHQSLRGITRADVLAALPADPRHRKLCGQALRSIFGVLKARKLIFTNPALRLAHSTDTPIPPAVIDLDAVRDALNSPDPARAVLTALVAYHGLRSHQLRDLHLTAIRDRHLHLDGRRIPLADPVRRRLATWLDHRTQRWPTSTNPHLFIHFRTARRHEPVGARWIWLTLDLPGGVQALRQDRILQEAIATNGDPRRLCDLFGLSISHASRYTDAIREPDTPS